jgi:hypothetical protein
MRVSLMSEIIGGLVNFPKSGYFCGCGCGVTTDAPSKPPQRAETVDLRTWKNGDLNKLMVIEKSHVPRATSQPRSEPEHMKTYPRYEVSEACRLSIEARECSARAQLLGFMHQYISLYRVLHMLRDNRRESRVVRWAELKIYVDC